MNAPLDSDHNPQGDRPRSRYAASSFSARTSFSAKSGVNAPRCNGIGTGFVEALTRWPRTNQSDGNKLSSFKRGVSICNAALPGCQRKRSRGRSRKRVSVSIGRRKLAVSGTSSKYSGRKCETCATSSSVQSGFFSRTLRASNISSSHLRAVGRFSTKKARRFLRPPSQRLIASSHRSSVHCLQSSGSTNNRSHTSTNPLHIRTGIPTWRTAD